MKKYRFHSSLREAELRSVIADLPHVGLSAVTKTDNYYGDVVNNRIYIGYTSDTLLSNFSFFCGRIKLSPKGTSITGRFEPPIKLVAIPYIIICIILLAIGGIVGLIMGMLGCILLHLLQIVFLSVNTCSKKEIISFITNNLDSTRQ